MTPTPFAVVGLGTSTPKEAKEYFAQMDSHQIAFEWVDEEDDKKVMSGIAVLVASWEVHILRIGAATDARLWSGIWISRRLSSRSARSSRMHARSG